MAPRTRRQTPTPPAPVPLAPTEPVVTADGLTQPPRLARIAQRAYAIYERRGGQHGRALEDWLQAEREIDSEA